jgi:hypothetical protein
MFVAIVQGIAFLLYPGPSGAKDFAQCAKVYAAKVCKGLRGVSLRSERNHESIRESPESVSLETWHPDCKYNFSWPRRIIAQSGSQGIRSEPWQTLF